MTSSSSRSTLRTMASSSTSFPLVYFLEVGEGVMFPFSSVIVKQSFYEHGLNVIQGLSLSTANLYLNVCQDTSRTIFTLLDISSLSHLFGNQNSFVTSGSMEEWM